MLSTPAASVVEPTKQSGTKVMRAWALFLASRVSQNMVFAEVVPARLVRATSRAATLFARGSESGFVAVSPEVLNLVDDALAGRVGLAARGSAPALLGLGLIAAAAIVLILYATVSRGQDLPTHRGTPPAGASGRIPHSRCQPAP